MATVTKGVLKLHTKWTARRLTADAMFAAMVTVLAAAAIKTGNLKITIEAMPVFLGALMLGPVDGMVIGGIGTLLYQLLSYGVTATTALWIAPYVLLGLCVGAVSARHGYACTKRQLVLLVVFGELGITALNTASLYIDSLIYGYYSPVFVFGTLPLRLGICAAKAVVFSLLLPSLLPPTVLAELTVAFCFVCLLHLCNERGVALSLEPATQELVASRRRRQ